MSRTEKLPEPLAGDSGQEDSPLGLACRAYKLVASGSWVIVLLVLIALAQFSEFFLLLGAGVVASTGSLHWRHVNERLRDPAYVGTRRSRKKHRKMRELLAADLRLAHRWVGVGAGVGVLALLGGSPEYVLALSGVGSLLIFFTYFNAFVIGTDIAAQESLLKIPVSNSPTGEQMANRALRAPNLPFVSQLARFGRRPRKGEIGNFLTGLLLVVVSVAVIFLGVAGGKVLEMSGGAKRAISKQRQSQDRPEPEREEGEDAIASPAGALAEDEPTYAELCSELPDPLDIGHGLGEQFRRAGAIKAGCGTPERLLDGIWISEGICSEELHSLAIASPGYAAVLLYGEPARFALQKAEEGDLVFADVAEPGSGEVVAIGTDSGTYMFARMSPSLSPGREDARSCTETGGEARPFAELPPPLSQLWLWHVQDEGWAWPAEDAGSGEMSFLDHDTGEPTANARCEVDDLGECVLEGGGEPLAAAGPARVSLGELVPYMPVHVE